MQITIDALLIVLLLVGIGVTGGVGMRLYTVLGSVKQTLDNVEQTRSEINGTLKRLEAVADTTEQLMRDEIAPTLQIARQTLVNVEITTRGLAETTQIVRGLAGKVDGAQKVFSVGGPIAQLLLKKAGGAASGFFSGVTAGIKMALGHRKKTEPAPKQIASNGKKPEKRISASEENDAMPGMLEELDKKPLVAKRRH